MLAKVEYYNEYEIHFWYAGMEGCTILKNGVEVYHGFSADEVLERFGFNPWEVGFGRL